MNAAFLLIATAWIAGADDVKPADKPVDKPADVKPIVTPAPAYVPAGPGCGDCGATGCGCESTCCEKESCFSKLKARFHHKSCGCETSCGCAPAPSCGCETSCGCGPNFFERLKARFHHHESCGCDTCDTCGTGCCGAGMPGPTMQKVEPIPGPKTDPGKPLPKVDDGAKQVQVVPSSKTPVLEVTPAKADSPF